MSHAIARAVSIFGHPMLVLPLAAVVLLLLRGQQQTALWITLCFAVFAGVVMAWSTWQVRRGHWAHVDASGKHERSSLNRFLLVMLGLSALGAVLLQAKEPAIALALCAAMVAMAMATARWCKLSLHMAFVVFATVLLGNAHWWLGLPSLLFAGAVAWSRLRLQRHVPRDLVAGALTGALAGIACVAPLVAGAS
ncbi:phosphatase PAP2 family protein [Pseudoxanthomonas gei]|nr:phosphatase PAP2 family protein [Pseudoxanthomonas gei]